jgi:hypothetical protein
MHRVESAVARLSLSRRPTTPEHAQTRHSEPIQRDQYLQCTEDSEQAEVVDVGGPRNTTPNTASSNISAHSSPSRLTISAAVSRTQPPCLRGPKGR